MSEMVPSAASAPQEAESEISLLDMLLVLARYKFMIVGLPIVVAAIAAALSLKQPDIFTASVKILPPQQSQSVAAGLLSQLGGAASSLAAGTLGGLKSPADVYVAMIRSRSVADAMIKRFGLMKPDEKYPSQVRQNLASSTNAVIGKDGVINIEFDDPDPKRAADFANAYVEELIKFAGGLALTETSQKRLFFERQVEQARESLAKAEVAARRALDQGGLVKVDDQGRTMATTISYLRSQISRKEVQIGAMRSFASDQNPELVLVRQELESLKHELAKMEGAGGAKASSNRSNGNGGESLRLLRDLRASELIVEQIARQYELAKIEEAKDPSIIQVMDRAVVPDRKSKPNRTLSVLIAALATLVLSVILAFSLEAMGRTRRNPRNAEKLGLLRKNLTKIW